MAAGTAGGAASREELGGCKAPWDSSPAQALAPGGRPSPNPKQRTPWASGGAEPGLGASLSPTPASAPRPQWEGDLERSRESRGPRPLSPVLLT